MDDSFWDFYWEVRLQELQDLGKREAILAASRLVRSLEQEHRPARLLELGCGEGQIIGALVQAHAQVEGIQTSVGVDYKPAAIEYCRQAYPSMRFIEGDFTSRALLSSLGRFQIVLLVNALHEVFSAVTSPELEEVDVPVARQRVLQALSGAASCLAEDGYLLLFDGLEASGDISQPVRVRFLHVQARDQFFEFAAEYRPFRIAYRQAGDAFTFEMSRRDFTRYITKSIFLGKRLWRTERLESYQYFNKSEFQKAISTVGLKICDLHTLTVDYEKWSSLVEIETPGIDFPAEHILIVAKAA